MAIGDDLTLFSLLENELPFSISTAWIAKTSPDGKVGLSAPQQIIVPLSLPSVYPEFITLYPGGRLLVGGSVFSSTTTFSYFWAAVYFQDTLLLDTSFGGTGDFVFPGHVIYRGYSFQPSFHSVVFGLNSMVLIGSGRIEEETATSQSSPQTVLMKLDQDGRWITNWANNGVLIRNATFGGSEGVCGLLYGNKTIIVSNLNRNGPGSVDVMTIDLDGEIEQSTNIVFPGVVDTSNPNITYYHSSVAHDCFRNPTNGELVIVGRTLHYEFVAARVRAGDLTMDTTFGVNGFAVIPEFKSASTNHFSVHGVVMPDLKYVLIGAVGTFPNFTVSSVRLNNDGSRDLTYAREDIDVGSIPQVNNVLAQNTGKIIVVGNSYYPTAIGTLLRLNYDEQNNATACDLGPQCFCLQQNCMTQGDYIVPFGNVPVMGVSTTNGNYIGSPRSTLSIAPGGKVLVGGTTFAGGSNLVVSVRSSDSSSTVTILNSPGGILGDFGSISVQPNNEECKTGDSSSIEQDETSVSVQIIVSSIDGCLTTAQLIGVAVGATCAGIILAVVIVVITKWKLARYTAAATVALKNKELSDLNLNPYAQNIDLEAQNNSGSDHSGDL